MPNEIFMSVQKRKVESGNNFQKLTIYSSNNNTKQINIFVIKAKVVCVVTPAEAKRGRKMENGRWKADSAEFEHEKDEKLVEGLKVSRVQRAKHFSFF
jgi:hypothetical protein